MSFFKSLESKAKTEWMDEYGHLNIQFYLKLFNDAWVNLFRDMDLDIFASETGVVASRILMSHRAEVCENENLEIHSGFSAIHKNYVTVKQKLSVEGRTRATCDARLYAFDLRVRKMGEFSAMHLEKAGRYKISGAEDCFEE